MSSRLIDEVIIGVDPGKVTGLSILDRDKRFTTQLPARSAVLFLWREMDGYRLVKRRLVLCCERYTVDANTHKKTRQYDALHVAGALKYKCAANDQEFTEYERADAKHFSTDKKLVAMDFYDKTMVHANDASRQVILHLARTNALPKLDLK